MVLKALCGHDLEWHNLYRRDYDLAVPESMSHPAKASWDLAFRILEHLEEMGLLKPGMAVLDALAGTGRFNIAACARGYRAISCELESKFVSMQVANKEYASKKLGREIDWTIVQGDSRKLSELLGERGLVSVISPPYLESNIGRPKERHNRQVILGGSRGFGTNASGDIGVTSYGDTPGQIGSLKDKPISIVSPPYANFHPWSQSPDELDAYEQKRAKELGFKPPTSSRVGFRGHYGDPANSENIGNLPDKPISITSPPYSDMNHPTNYLGKQKRESCSEYSDNENNIGNLKDKPIWKGELQETYLSAMFQVYREMAKVSDVAVIVTKNPTREGKLRRLDEDTLAILEAAGWKLHCRHRAILFEEQEMQDLFGASKKQVKGRMSFFKRLSWLKGAPVAKWEDVLVMVR